MILRTLIYWSAKLSKLHHLQFIALAFLWLACKFAFSAQKTFNLRDDDQRRRNTLFCRTGTPKDLVSFQTDLSGLSNQCGVDHYSSPEVEPMNEFCGVWKITVSGQKQAVYLRIDNHGNIDYAALPPDIACKFRRPATAGVYSDYGLNFDLQFTSWELDWEKYFDHGTAFECHYCKHCKYEGYDSFWLDRKILDYSDRDFKSQEDVTRLCGGDDSGRVPTSDKLSKLVEEYTLTVQGGELPLQWSRCTKHHGGNCLGVQSANQTCRSSGFCRSIPSNSWIQQCGSRSDSSCSNTDGGWGEWGEYYPAMCPNATESCVPSTRCRRRACNNPFAYPPSNNCKSGSHLEVQYCFPKCGWLQVILPYMKQAALALVAVILFAAVCTVMFAKDERTFEDVMVPRMRKSTMGRVSTADSRVTTGTRSRKGKKSLPKKVDKKKEKPKAKSKGKIK